MSLVGFLWWAGIGFDMDKNKMLINGTSDVVWDDTNKYFWLSFILHPHSHQSTSMEDARIKIPTDESINLYKTSVQTRHPSLENVWCTMDGLKLLLECSSDEDEQNRYYNGWTCDHYISAVLVFCPDGTIPIAAFNMPGSFHDSSVAEYWGVYAKLEMMFDMFGVRCMADSAFSGRSYILLSSHHKMSLIAIVWRFGRHVMLQNFANHQSGGWVVFNPLFLGRKMRCLWKHVGSADSFWSFLFTYSTIGRMYLVVIKYVLHYA